VRHGKGGGRRGEGCEEEGGGERGEERRGEGGGEREGGERGGGMSGEEDEQGVERRTDAEIKRGRAYFIF